MEKYALSQNYNMYKQEDHKTWSILSKRQSELLHVDLSTDYLDGISKLNLDRINIARIEEVSKVLESITGWTLMPVPGLIPTRDFFYMLINKKYPVTTAIRKPWEIDFSEQPDIFHDIYGHLPLLTNEKFTRFLTAYSIIALKYINNDRAIDFLGRLYWFTYEMGLIEEDGKYKPYGGAIITSAEEISNTRNESIPKYRFDLEHIFRTPYNSFKLQKEYFVINSFDDLFGCIDQLEARLIEQLLLPEEDYTLRNYPLNKHLREEFNNVIGFLNDIHHKFPDSISFAAGQPDESFFNIERHISKFDTYVQYMMEKTGHTRGKVVNGIGQYNKTKGIINDIVAKYLYNDENINVKGDHILMTVGAQEAFAVIVSTICDKEKDVILMENPSYIGVNSFSRLFDYNIQGIRVDEEGIDIQMLKERILEINRSGSRVKLLYTIPDYQNPTGSCAPIGSRLKLLELAQKYNFLIIEDSVYNSFTYAQRKNPTLKSLDKYNRVIYVGSFSKSLFPGLRIGLIAADQYIETGVGENVLLVDEMAKVKAQITNNTPTLNQAILGGVLLDMNYSLNELNRSKFKSYKTKRDQMVSSLNKHFRTNDPEWAQDIKWNVPDGGFFIKMSLPFDIDDESVLECAREYGAIFCPMRYFYLDNGGRNEIRLSFSNLSMSDIETGVGNLAGYMRSRISGARALNVQGVAATTNY